METIQRMTARSILSLGSRRRNDKPRSSSKGAGDGSSASSSSSSSPKTDGRQIAPHPIPAGSEGRACPISGLFADAEVVQVQAASKAQLLALQADPDIAEELQALSASPLSGRAEAEVQPRKPVQLVKFIAFDGKYRSSSSTAELVRQVGFPALARFTRSFYEKCFADGHVDQFIASHDEPHHERFALWIQEKLGDGNPWTQERRTRLK